MIEQVARAIYETIPVGERGWDDAPAYTRDRCIECARAAIAAMREPTEAMLIGARDWSLAKNGQGVGNDQATGCWQAMIDAALADNNT